MSSYNNRQNHHQINIQTNIIAALLLPLLCWTRFTTVYYLFNYLITGDSGYPLEPWLFTCYEQPGTQNQRQFNKSFKSTRCVVERTIGLWKSVFRLLDESAGKLMYSPEKACKIIVVAAILHNLRRKLRLSVDESFEVPPALFEDVLQFGNACDSALFQAGNQLRQTVTNNFF